MIEQGIINYISDNNLPVRVYSEECGIVNIHPEPEYIFSMDPLDGSVNYKIGKGYLPFGSLFAFFKGTDPKLDDVVAAAVIDYTTGTYFIYDGKETIDHEGKRIILDRRWQVHSTTPLYLDTFYKNGLKAYSTFAEKLFVRGTGSIVGNLMLTLQNVSAVTGGTSVRAEEVGAVYALIKGAGGIIIDHFGIPLGEKLFKTDLTYSLLAGNEKVTRFMVQRMMFPE